MNNLSENQKLSIWAMSAQTFHAANCTSFKEHLEDVIDAHQLLWKSELIPEPSHEQ